MGTTDAELIAAIHHDRLADLDHAEAQAVCRAIGQRMADEVTDAVSILAAAGIDAAADGDPGSPGQRHSATLIVADGETAIAAARALQAHGYRPWEPVDGAAEPVLRRLRSTLTMARTDDVTVVLELRWPATPWATGLPAALVPNENDYEAVSLPAALWPLYLIVRPLRLLAERLGLRPSTGQALGPFLSTPTDLIGPLLDLADVGPTDTLVDLGCGDAGVLRHAVAERGCRGIGVESDPDLAGEARRLVDEAGLADRVTIIEGDANADRLPAEVAGGTVFFLFVPAYAVPPVAARVLAQAQPGSRLIIHEQHPLPDLVTGIDRISVPLLSGQGVTVAHRIGVVDAA